VGFRGASARIRNMTQMWGTLQDVGVALSRVFEMMAKMPEEKSSAAASFRIRPRTSSHSRTSVSPTMRETRS